MDGCVCVSVCSNFGKFKLLYLRNYSIELKFGAHSKSRCGPSFDIIYVKIDSWIGIL